MLLGSSFATNTFTHRIAKASRARMVGKKKKATKTAKPTGRLRAKAKAKATPRPQKVQRQLHRRSAIKLLNDVTAELSLGVTPLRLKERSAAVVTRRVKLLEPRCQEDSLAKRLRQAVEQYVNNGGKLLRQVIPATQASDASNEKDATVTEDFNDTDAVRATDEAAVPLHRVLEGSFHLHSKAFMLTYNSDSFTPECWERFKKQIRELHASLKSRAWAATLEKSLHTADSQARYHLHAYFYWNDGVGLHRRNTDEFVFDGVHPRVDVNTATAPWTFYSAACRGLWYVSVMKLGTMKSATNFRPWRRYVPKVQWLQDLYAAQKLTHDQYLELSVNFGPGHSNRRRDLFDAVRDEREASVQSHVTQELNLLKEAGLLKKARQFDVVDKFVSCFVGAPMFRRPILVIVGGTNLGKSILAADVLHKIATALGLESFLEITVEGNDTLDLGDFDHRKQAGVLFDGVGDAMFLKQNREVLQGRPKKCKGGQSATMMYSYPFTLCRRAVVATFDLSATNLPLLKTDHWLSDSRNVLLLHLTEPAWDGGHGTKRSAPMDPKETMAAWTVDALAKFLESEDLHGPAAAFRTSGVSGSDFLAWTDANSLATDLRLTPFAARKLLACRAKFLEDQ